MPDYRKSRIKALRSRIDSWGCDALLVTNARDIRYLTGFCGEDSWLVVRAKSATAIVISDSRFEEEIPQNAPGVRTIIRNSTSLPCELGKLVTKFDMSKVGIQQTYVTVNLRKSIAKEIKASKIKDVDDGLLIQRSFKDKFEMKLLRKAVNIQQAAFLETCKYIKPGMAEGEIAGYLEMRMRAHGAEGPAFDTIVGADANGSKPHYTPGTAKAKKGGTILIDWGACYQGYRSDMTRVVALGKWPAKMKEIYKIVHEAMETAIDLIAPGVELAAVDKAARDIVKKAGYGKRFRHGLGHGIGLNIHESPNFGQRSKGVLEAGQVVTIEPGIYLPGIGGVRLEDDIEVTAKGHRNLCDLPKGIESAII